MKKHLIFLSNGYWKQYLRVFSFKDWLNGVRSNETDSPGSGMVEGAD